ncbi:hypothetical protein B0H19DRAFT_1057151 [Mycena capillaripes]|nr:hypothetical protein B0H19DRAFT_1057151 [Mycena capillaripes]
MCPMKREVRRFLSGVCVGQRGYGMVTLGDVSGVETKLGCGIVPTSLRRLIEPHGVLRIWSLRGVGSSHRDGAGVPNYEAMLKASSSWELRVCGVPNPRFHGRPHRLTPAHCVSGSVEADQTPVLIFCATAEQNWTQMFYWLCSRDVGCGSVLMSAACFCAELVCRLAACMKYGVRDLF